MIEISITVFFLKWEVMTEWRHKRTFWGARKFLCLELGECYTCVFEHKYSLSLSPEALSLSLSPSLSFSPYLLSLNSSLWPFHYVLQPGLPLTIPLNLLYYLGSSITTLLQNSMGILKFQYSLTSSLHFKPCISLLSLTIPHSPDYQLLLPPCPFMLSQGVGQYL